MEQAVIVSAVRTPVGSFAGRIKDVSATELGIHAVRSALERAEVAGWEVDEVRRPGPSGDHRQRGLTVVATSRGHRRLA
jgi:acetyl-CoA acetyltransferase